MPRLIAGILLIAAFAVLTPLAASALQVAKGPGFAQKREKCRELARERGFLGGGRTKGAIKPRDFVIACMQGKVS